jgi:hypothetical protein
LSDRVASLAAFEGEGRMTTWEQLGESRFILREHNCPILKVVEKFDHPCRCEIDLLRQTLRQRSNALATSPMGTSLACTKSRRSTAAPLQNKAQSRSKSKGAGRDTTARFSDRPRHRRPDIPKIQAQGGENEFRGCSSSRVDRRVNHVGSVGLGSGAECHARAGLAPTSATHSRLQRSGPIYDCAYIPVYNKRRLSIAKTLKSDVLKGTYCGKLRLPLARWEDPLMADQAVTTAGRNHTAIAEVSAAKA